MIPTDRTHNTKTHAKQAHTYTRTTVHERPTDEYEGPYALLQCLRQTRVLCASSLLYCRTYVSPPSAPLLTCAHTHVHTHTHELGMIGVVLLSSKMQPRVSLTVTTAASPHAHIPTTGTSSDRRVAKTARHRFRLKTAFFSDLPCVASRWRSTFRCFPCATAVCEGRGRFTVHARAPQRYRLGIHNKDTAIL